MYQSYENETLVGRRLFGEYTMVRKLGEGGMGAVYLLQHDSIDQQIAVKVLHGRSAQQDELVKRFYREAKSISLLSHPNITRLFIFGRSEDGLIYLAMEYVNGLSLREVFAEGPLNELRAIKIMKQVLGALSEAHSIGIIHRDLKPDNIMLTKHRGQPDYVKVLDFGIAKVTDQAGLKPEQKLTQAGVVNGTPEYLSPEQAQAIELDQRSDIYSLGCVLYEMITGSVPFSAPTAVTVLTMHVFEEPKRPSEVYSRCSPQMEDVILKAMAKKPDDRYASSEEFLDALSELEGVLSGTPSKGRKVSAPVSDLELESKPMLPKTKMIKLPLDSGPSAKLTSASKLPKAVEGDEEERRAEMMQKVLISAIVFSGLVLVAIIFAIIVAVKFKAG